MPDINFLSGARLEGDRRLFFETMKSGRAYLGFGRATPEWGQSALIRIEHQSGADQVDVDWPVDIMGQNDADTTKFYDINSTLLPGVTTPPTGGDRIFIKTIDKAADEEIAGNYATVPEEVLGQVYLEYMNSGWAQLNGLRPQFTFPDRDTKDYYIFNYSDTLLTRVKIREVNITQYLTSVSLPVKLASSQTSDVIYEVIHNDAGLLTRQVSTTGEVLVAGMEPLFDEEPFVNDHWFLITQAGVIMQDKLTLVDSITTAEEKILLFEYETVAGNTATLKVTTGQGTLNRIGVWNESFNINSASPVADNNPPSLKLSYIKDSFIEKSPFDVRGIVQITENEVEFARQVIDAEDEAILIGKHFVIETFIIQTDTATEVKFARTDSGSMANTIATALNEGCDSVMVLKTVPKADDSGSPTSDTYRQLFISYSPSDSNGDICTAQTYNTSTLFNLTTYEFDLGILFYIANKIPIVRAFLAADEEFTIIL